MRKRCSALLGALLALLAACAETATDGIEGRPRGPYRQMLTLEPAHPLADRSTTLTSQIRLRANDAPVTDLQVLHQRIVHNFIVNLDFSSFAHIHHEDFHPLTADNLARAEFSFPYVFPRAGRYRMVSEFTHRDRSWTKHFDITVGAAHPAAPVAIDLAREKERHGFRARLALSPPVAAAGVETELVLELARGDEPVADLQLILGSEIHAAFWRIDGEHFGHAHSYTPAMAALMHTMHDPDQPPAARTRHAAEMMVAMMKLPEQLVFPGPRVPLRHVFPAPGVYALFIQCAPGGNAQVFDFMLEVVPYAEGMDTSIESIVRTAGPHADGHR